MAYDKWQAPDRDTPTTLEFRATVELGTQLDALLRTEGMSGYDEAQVAEASGIAVSRPRRWHKMFERMGLIYPDATGHTQLTALGSSIRAAQSDAGRDFRRAIARKAVHVLRKYQLLNPADKTGTEDYPSDTNLHPYWAIWKAAVELDGKLHWDELNRVLMWVLKHEDLDAAIARIRTARADTGYAIDDDAWASANLGPRAYDQTTTTDGRSAAGQVRDQKTTPWFKRAALGELLFSSPGHSGNGFWSIHPDVRDILEADVQEAPPFLPFDNAQEWFAYYGSDDEPNVAATISTSATSPEIPTRLALLLKRKNVVYFGPPGTGKTYSALELASVWAAQNGQDSVFKVTFHPSYGYEDFVQGYRPSGEGGSGFRLQPGILLTAALRAEELKAAQKSVLLFIDEINRGDVARIFGELITYIEPDKRDIPCTLASSPTATFSVPDNLYFLGTMNTADKSVSLIDVAMRRRFAFVGFPPDPTAFDRIADWLPSVAGISLRDVLTTLNDRLASEGIESDRSIGHALLRIESGSTTPLADLRAAFEYDILPLASEYCYMERGRMRRILGALVDEAGNPSLGNEAEFEERLRAWLGHAIPEAVTSEPSASVGA